LSFALYLLRLYLLEEYPTNLKSYYIHTISLNSCGCYYFRQSRTISGGKRYPPNVISYPQIFLASRTNSSLSCDSALESLVKNIRLLRHSLSGTSFYGEIGITRRTHTPPPQKTIILSTQSPKPSKVIRNPINNTNHTRNCQVNNVLIFN
jgi:hypothetical protein